jgi:FkbM family methyltransferase
MKNIYLIFGLVLLYIIHRVYNKYSEKLEIDILTNQLKSYNFHYTDEKDNKINHLSEETTEQMLALKYIKPNDVVLELGARYGTVSCIINKILNNKNNQVSVEPDKNIWNTLDNNLTTNKCNANIVKGFISKRSLELNNWGYASQETENPNTTTPNYTLDYIKKKYGISNFNVLIVDCEGCMESFLNENPELISTLRLVMFEKDYPENCNYDKIMKMLADHNFTQVESTMHEVWEKY